MKHKTPFTKNVHCFCDFYADCDGYYHMGLPRMPWDISSGLFYQAMKAGRQVWISSLPSEPFGVPLIAFSLSLFSLFLSLQLHWGPWNSVCSMTRRTMHFTAPLTKPRWAATMTIIMTLICSLYIYIKHFCLDICWILKETFCIESLRTQSSCNSSVICDTWLVSALSKSVSNSLVILNIRT